MGWDPMGGDPWEPKGIPWEGTDGRGTLGSPRDPMGGDLPWKGNPCEPKGSHGRGTFGSPRDPMGGDPWGPHWEPISRYFVTKLPSKNNENHENRVF